MEASIKATNYYNLSYFDKEGIRYRKLSSKMNSRWMMIGLPKPVWNYVGYIYTLEQALELGIEFREDWRSRDKNKERIIFDEDKPHIFFQKDDWCLTEAPDPNGELWVMQCLWRNEHINLPNARFPNGVFSYAGRRKFTGEDVPGGNNIGYYANWGNPKASFTQREKVFIHFLVENILDQGYYGFAIVKKSYQMAYHNTPSVKETHLAMRSEKIMSAVAKQLKEALKKSDMDIDWVLKQLRDMGEKDHAKDPNRRFEVVKLVGRMNAMPVGEGVALPSGENNITSIEAEEVSDDLAKIEEKTRKEDADEG